MGTAPVTGEKRSAEDAAVADENRDGSPPKKVAESKPEEQPVAEAMDVAEKKEEDSPPAEPVATENVEKTVETAAEVEKTVETAVEAAASACAEPVATQ